MLQNQFDLAARLGHFACRHLSSAVGVYQEARRMGWLDLDQHDWRQCLSIMSRLTCLREVELDHTMSAVVLFQAMLEKIPYFLPTFGTGLVAPSATSFAGAWNQLLDQIGDSSVKTTAIADFDAYKTSIYDNARNPIIHGKLAADVAAVSKLRLTVAHEGFRRAWAAYDALISEVAVGHLPSWATYCAANGVPSEIDAADFPDLEQLSVKFIEKHLTGANAVRES